MINSRVKKALRISGIIISVLILFFFVFRNAILLWGIGKASGILKDRTGATLTVGSSKFTGFSTVSLQQLVVLPLQGDTLVKADTLVVELSFWNLLRGVIKLNELDAGDVRITVSCRDSICNYSGFLSGKETIGVNTGKNYALLLRKMLDRAYNLAPQRANLRNIDVHFRNDSLERFLEIVEFRSDEDSIGGILEDKKSQVTWGCSGQFSQSNHSLNMTVFPRTANRQLLPLIDDLMGMALSFDSLHIGMKGYQYNGETLAIDGQFTVKEFNVFNKRISDDTVGVAFASFDFEISAGKDFLQLDSTSSGELGRIHFKPFLRYESTRSKIYSFNIETGNTNANDFFTSLPSGMFDEIREMRADGNIAFNLDFKINSSKPEDVIFESSLKKQKFRLRKTGSLNLMKLNGEFTHHVYERGRFIRSIVIGPSNSNYTPLEKISPDFVNAVLTSEDGNFYFHNGFNEEAFRKSIIANFKAGKFVRGGSTISMQLVKNVFLTRKKTIARKAEEALLVWLIESNRLYSKERMLEVYMNIIELGPDIYGVGEASEFYFKKRPDDLSLPEGIFLASLLPHPKWFKYSFDTLGNLKPYLADYYRVVSDFMLRKNLISQEQHDELVPKIKLKGPAREMVIP